MKYEPALDGLRSVAVFAVILYHVSGTLLPGGWAGVDIFFVLSGYLITSILISELNATGRVDFRRFYMHRVLRLAPALLCLFLFEIVRAMLQIDGAQRLQMLEATAVSAAYFMNWSRAFNLFPQDVLGHTWSLSMEEEFYLLWPITLVFLRNRRPIFWTTLAVFVVTQWRLFLALSGADPERTYNGFDTHSDALLIGCLLSLIPVDARISGAARTNVFIPVLLMIGMFVFLPHRTLFTQTIGLSLSAFSSAWIIVSLFGKGWLTRLLSLRPFVYTGRISYGWYLWHYPIIVIGKTYLPRDNLMNSVGLAALVVFSYGVAVFSFELIEKPFLRLKSRFDARPS